MVSNLSVMIYFLYIYTDKFIFFVRVHIHNVFLILKKIRGRLSIANLDKTKVFMCVTIIIM